MTYYDPLIAKWPALGAAAIDQARVDAAKEAFAIDPPTIPTRNEDETVEDFEKRLDSANEARDAWRETWAPIFHDAAVVAKIDALNALTAPGPNVDVQIPSVVGLLMLSGAYLKLAAFAASAPTNDPTHDAALGAGKTLMALLTTQNAPPFNTSNAKNYAIIAGMSAALLAQETAASGTTGFTQAVHDGLLALAATTIPWWQSAGYPGPISAADLEAVFVASQTVLV